MSQDILDRLLLDPASRTLGELLQERESAAHEIRRLRAAQDLSHSALSRTQSESARYNAVAAAESTHGQVLIKLKDLCEQLGVSRSTVYKWIHEDKFPRPSMLASVQFVGGYRT